MNRTNESSPARRLGVAFIGSGFNAHFHLQAFRAVRDADVLGVWSPNKKNAASAAEEMSAATQQLASMAQELQKLTAQFKIAAEESRVIEKGEGKVLLHRAVS